MDQSRCTTERDILSETNCVKTVIVYITQSGQNRQQQDLDKSTWAWMKFPHVPDKLALQIAGYFPQRQPISTHETGSTRSNLQNATNQR